MTAHTDRARVLEEFGYTARQAHFLTLVALHGGYFLRRQYVAFTGRAHGQATVRFIAKAVAREHIRVLPYGRQGHLFHVCARPLYAAIGEEHNGDGSIWSTEVASAAPAPCALRVYELGIRYDDRRTAKRATSHESQVT